MSLNQEGRTSSIASQMMEASDKLAEKGTADSNKVTGAFQFVIAMGIQTAVPFIDLAEVVVRKKR